MSIGTAFRFLTILPIPGRAVVTDRQLGRATAWYPLVGGLLGALVAAAALACGLVWSGMVSAAVSITLWVVLTRGLHLDGLADTFDGLGGGATPERRLAIMKDSRVGTFGVVAIVLSLLLKLVLVVELLGDGALRVLPVAPVLGRWAMVLGIYAFPAASEQGMGVKVKRNCRWVELLIATVTAVAGAWLLAGPWGLAAVAVVAAASGLLSLHCRRRLGGLNGDVYGAVCEIGEVAALGTLAVLGRLEVLR